MEENQNNTFEYTYCALTEKEKKEIASIRRQYEETVESGEDKVERIKYLDAKVRNTATCISLVFGVIGCLIFGLGLTMILEWGILVWGIVVMMIGCVPMFLAYPVFNWLFARGKKKYGAEILRLSEELLQKNA